MGKRMIYSNKNHKYVSINGAGHRYAAFIATLIHCSTNRRPLCGHTGNLIPACCTNQIKKRLTLEKQPHSGDHFVASGNISDQIKPHSGDLNFLKKFEVEYDERFLFEWIKTE